MSLAQALDRISEWTKEVDLQIRTEVEAGTEMEQKTEKLGEVSALEPGELLEQLRQFELLLASTEQIKIRDRQQFETDFLEIKDLISEKTLLQVTPLLFLFSSVMFGPGGRRLGQAGGEAEEGDGQTRLAEAARHRGEAAGGLQLC